MKYVLKKRKSDGKMCLYLKKYNVVVAEFVDNTIQAQEDVIDALKVKHVQKEIIRVLSMLKVEVNPEQEIELGELAEDLVSNYRGNETLSHSYIGGNIIDFINKLMEKNDGKK